jgi:methylglutaconyl-CoA hydratase
MDSYETIRVEESPVGVVNVVLSRPQVRNAFNEVMIRELTDAFANVPRRPGARVVLVQSEGNVFCAGADLNWMKRSVELSPEENRAETMELATLLETLDECPRPTVARVQGAVMGGGLGLVSACDIVVASEDAFFALSEVRLGLAPATISPFVIRRMGPGLAREFFLTGSRISASRAREIGLVNYVVAPETLDETVAKIVERLLAGGPKAQAACKELIRHVPGLDGGKLKSHTAHVISDLRAGEEGQEGMKAFFEKRPPSWKTESGRG